MVLSSQAHLAGFRANEGKPEVSLYSARYRNYHPGLGRWIERDPEGYVDGANLYAYCKSAPANWVDYLGTEAVTSVMFGSAVLGPEAPVAVGLGVLTAVAAKASYDQAWATHDSVMSQHLQMRAAIAMEEAKMLGVPMALCASAETLNQLELIRRKQTLDDIWMNKQGIPGQYLGPIDTPSPDPGGLPDLPFGWGSVSKAVAVTLIVSGAGFMYLVLTGKMDTEGERIEQDKGGGDYHRSLQPGQEPGTGTSVTSPHEQPGVPKPWVEVQTPLPGPDHGDGADPYDPYYHDFDPNDDDYWNAYANDDYEVQDAPD